jgi:hypothetical protein
MEVRPLFTIGYHCAAVFGFHADADPALFNLVDAVSVLHPDLDQNCNAFIPRKDVQATGEAFRPSKENIQLFEKLK